MAGWKVAAPTEMATPHIVVCSPFIKCLHRGLYTDIFKWPMDHYSRIILCDGRQGIDHWYSSLLLVVVHMQDLLTVFKEDSGSGLQH